MSVKSFYDAESKIYDSRYTDSIHEIEDKIVSKLIKGMYQKGVSLLDVGCGTGNVISWGNVHRSDYTGIDISGGMIEKAVAKYPNYSFRKMDANDLCAGKWDLITACYGQVNYIGLPKFLAVAERVLNPSGRIFCILYSGIDNKDVSTPSVFQKFYSPDEIKDSFESKGKSALVYYFSCPSSPINLSCQWRALDGSSGDSKYYMVVSKW